MESHKNHVPNHQPASFLSSNLCLILSHLLVLGSHDDNTIFRTWSMWFLWGWFMKACAWFYGDLHAETHIQIAHLKKKKNQTISCQKQSPLTSFKSMLHMNPYFFKYRSFPSQKTSKTPKKPSNSGAALRRYARPARLPSPTKWQRSQQPRETTWTLSAWPFQMAGINTSYSNYHGIIQH